MDRRYRCPAFKSKLGRLASSSHTAKPSDAGRTSLKRIDLTSAAPTVSMVQVVHTVQMDPMAVQGAMEAMAAAAEMVAMGPNPI